MKLLDSICVDRVFHRFKERVSYPLIDDVGFLL